MLLALIIDDDPVCRKIAKKLFEDLGFEAETRENGLQGLKRCSETPAPDIVLVDILMPEMGGLQFIQEAKALFPRIKTIAWTSSKELFLNAATKLGADGVLKKPFEKAELTTIVKKLFPHHVPSVEKKTRKTPPPKPAPEPVNPAIAADVVKKPRRRRLSYKRRVFGMN